MSSDFNDMPDYSEINKITSESICKRKGCSNETQASCCGCQDYFAWKEMEDKKKKESECKKSSNCPRHNIFEDMSDEDIKNLFNDNKEINTSDKNLNIVKEKISEEGDFDLDTYLQLFDDDEVIENSKTLAEPSEIPTPNGGMKVEHLTDIPSDVNYGKCGGIKNDINKPQLSLVPMQMVIDAALARMYGNNKYKGVPGYSSNNWCTIDKQRVIDALLRHILRYLDDQDGVDDESGLPHLCHVAANLAFLCEMQQPNWEEKKNKIIANDPILSKTNNSKEK